jgi:hypothetical protein
MLDWRELVVALVGAIAGWLARHFGPPNPKE